MKKISIIVPVYNAEEYVGQCVESLLNQTYRELQIILVDDGSRDGSLAECKRLAERDSRIEVIHQENAGPSTARNAGLDVATGEYVMFVDSDDTVTPDCCQKAVEGIEGVDIVFWGLTQVYDDGSTREYLPQGGTYMGREEAERGILTLKENAERYPFFGFSVNKLFRREIIEKEKVRFDERLRAMEDDIFTSTYIKAAKNIKILNQSLYNYYIRNNSLTAIHRPSEINNLIADLTKESATQYSNKDLLASENQKITTLYLLAALEEADRGIEAKRYSKARDYYTSYQTGRTLKFRLIFSSCKPLAKAVYCLYKRRYKRATLKR